MANLHGGILEGGSGKVGKIVVSSWKGIDYIRVIPDHVKNPRTPEQQSQRGKFKAVTNIAKMVFLPLIRQIWNPISKNNMGFNKFTKTNIHAFRDDGSIENYKDLQFSRGELSFPEEMQVRKVPNTESRIIINWSYNSEKENSNGNDILNIVAIEEYNNKYNLKILNKISFIRRQRQATIDLPFNGNHTLHLYPFFKGVDGTSYSHNSYAKVKPFQ